MAKRFKQGMNIAQLISKYHVAAPRYTSYPTVPYWDAVAPSQHAWISSVKENFKATNTKSGISVYIHLPYCESLCTYCGCNTRITKNHQVESPYISALLKEWQLYLAIFDEAPILKEIHLGGGTPTFFSPENLKVLLEGILKKAQLHPQAEFSFEAHPNNTSKEHLALLFSLGFKRLSLGIQDFDPQVQEIINRVQSFEQVQHICEEARTLGYSSLNFDLIYGLPLQNTLGLTDTIEKTIALKPDRIAFYSYAHVPWIKPGQRKFTEEHLPSVDEKQELYELGRKLLLDAGYKEIGMDHFALPSDTLFKAEESGELHRNFMGYTHQFTQVLVGLGVSSISDTGTAFAQNEKKVEDYLKRIAAQEFPICKGHMLTTEDRNIRTHILNLMCKGQTKWMDSELKDGNKEEILKRLHVLESDGLIYTSSEGLEVTLLGKRFLRNICMAFDARLWDNQPNTQLFSMAG